MGAGLLAQAKINEVEAAAGQLCLRSWLLSGHTFTEMPW